MPECLIWYLAIFHRLLVGMDTAAGSGDREAMWVYQWGADALHNVPGMLQRYDEGATYHSPADLARWVSALPQVVAGLGGLPRGVGLATALVTREAVHEELALAEDLSNLDLAPVAGLHEQLETLYRLCLDTRQRTLPQVMSERDWDYVEHLGRNNGRLARIAQAVPIGLVHWTTFAPAAFNAGLEQAYSQLERWDRPSRAGSAESH